MTWIIAVEGDVSNTLCDPGRIVRWGILVKVDECKRWLTQISARSTPRMKFRAPIHDSPLFNCKLPSPLPRDAFNGLLNLSDLVQALVPLFGGHSVQVGQERWNLYFAPDSLEPT